MRNVPNTVVHIQIGTFPINSARFDKLAKLLDKSLQSVESRCVRRYRLVNIVLIVANDVGEIVEDVLILLD